MKTKFLPLTAFLICICIVIGFPFFGQINPISAQTEQISNTVTPTPTEIISKTDSLSPTFSNSQGQIDELEAIKEKVDIISEYNDRMMVTVQWSIGIVLTIFTLMLFINWFTSYRQNENKLIAFKKTTLENITMGSEKQKNELIETIESKFNEIKKQINQKLEGTNKQIDKKLEDIEKQVNDYFKKNKEQIEAIIEDRMYPIEEDLVDVKFVQMKAKAQGSESNRVYTNAAVEYARMIILDPNHWNIGEILESLANVLTLCDSKLGASYVQTIQEAMDLLDNKFETHVEKIRLLVIEKC